MFLYQAELFQFQITGTQVTLVKDKRELADNTRKHQIPLGKSGSKPKLRCFSLSASLPFSFTPSFSPFLSQCLSQSPGSPILGFILRHDLSM